MSSDARGLSVRFVDAHSGRNDLLGRVAALESMAAVVARRLEGARPGSRFPLLRLLGREQPLTAVECESLAREVTRLRQLLALLPADETSAAGSDANDVADGLELTTLAPEGPVRDPAGRHAASPTAPRSLADAFAWPLFVLEHIARLGAASRRGARFEVGDPAAFAAARTPLRPHAGRV